ncbi:MAG: T9SS type A sorting domain-containing protein [Chitinophagaceae bacterium]|nr:T9SS type A sorting domain-containing protein [Chitinophagaceae bacterium]
MKPYLLFVLFFFAWFCTGFTVRAQVTADPGLPGPYAVARDTFDLGDLAFKPPSFPVSVELRGSVHYPSGLAGGPFPVVVFLHGRHVTAYKVSNPSVVNGKWPPDPGFTSITSFEGYDYFASTLASQGFIVISVSANGINAADAGTSDAGMNARAELVQKHLDLWKGYNTVGGTPFGTKFVGKLDMKRIGTMGHSRGGEGVVFHALLNRSLGSPYGIKAVLTLAPVNFYRQLLNDVPLMNIAPYCDGDVAGLNGVHYYDDARFTTTDTTPKYSVLLLGGNHNFFNTVWTPGSYKGGGASDDWMVYANPLDPWCGKSATSGRLDTGEQKAALTTYGCAFFRTHVTTDTSFLPILEVEDTHPPASSKLDSSQVFVSYHAPYKKRKDINRTSVVSNRLVNTLSGTVNSVGMVSSTICGGSISSMPSCMGGGGLKEPHAGTSSFDGLAAAALRWNNTSAYYENEIPGSDKDVTKYRSLSFRTAVNYVETFPARQLNFKVELVDSAGKTSSHKVSSVSHALFYQPGTTPSYLPKAMFNTVKMPLDSFKGINHTKVKSVRFLFNESDSGSVLVSDIAFSDIRKQPCGIAGAAFRDSLGTGYTVYFTDSSEKNEGDSLVLNWNFGDKVSGFKDTSSLRNPSHLFSKSGVFSVCLYLSVYRENGLVCRDTFCKNIALGPVGLNETPTYPVSIAPNPASDYLLVSGAMPGDVLELFTQYGQSVFKTSIGQTRIVLPVELSAGLYFAVIRTAHETMVHKIVLKK